MVNDNQTDDNEPQFAQALMKAGYEKPNSEGENNFLRKYDLSRDEQLSDDKNRVYKNNVTGKAYIVFAQVQKISVMWVQIWHCYSVSKKKTLVDLRELIK